MDEIKRGDKQLRDVLDKLKQGDITAIEGKTEFINSMAMLNIHFHGPQHTDGMIEDMANIILKVVNDNE